ncbi:MAG: NAD(P)-dependent glycerol-3-phosphate dehydrogenase [Alphaproteobacteria bacterium]|jgi:glycerol-3-phosphate dehydrogenase (NAD(P)+)|nr:NAD(P)-dependent glycerol-3-phosphate dehydrogenase [Alphaproteobacteria bacterium]
MFIMKKICIIGAGSWGTALALTAHRAGQQVTLLPRQPEQSVIINKTLENLVYLPGISLPPDLVITSDLSVISEADMVLQVTPAQTIAETCHMVKQYLQPDAPWVICAKGIVRGNEEKEPQLLSAMTRSILPNPIVILSGPSFADEVGLNLPTAVTIASEKEEVARLVASSLRHLRFRCYVSDDPIGVQVAGAVKNVLAIACGIVRGKSFGNNAASALITRGLAEMRRLGMALGGKSDTFMGLSGVGDVTLTCSSEQSRNMRLGIALGKEGANASKILKETAFIAEGVPTVAAVLRLSQTLSIPMPLCQAVYDIIYNDVAIDEVVDNILSRQSELEF